MEAGIEINRGHRLPSRVFSAPMAGYTDPPYRRLLKEFKVPVLFTEMIDSHALVHRNEKTMKMLGPDEPGTFTQIAAGTPTLADHAVNILLEEERSGINLNMGCPAKKVVSCGGGSNLLRSPCVVQSIVKTVRKKTDLPFSVKFRLGWNDELINYEEIGKIYEGEGADFVILHARTRAQAFSGKARWQHIGRLKEILKIPVIGNGDVVSYETAKALHEQSGCDGIAIGRGVIGNPWLYLQAAAAIAGEPPFPEPTPQERLRILTLHYEYILDYYGINLSSHIFRKHLVGYMRSLPGHKAIKEILFSEDQLTLEKLRNVLGEYFESLERDPGIYWQAQRASA